MCLAPPTASYSYAIIRLVPCVTRGEFVNVGVILFARTFGFLETRIEVDRDRVRALAPDLDLDLVVRHLRNLQRISAGVPDAGPVATLPPSERFHWLTAPRSTMIQPSPVHVGLTDDPAAALEHLMDVYVRRRRCVAPSAGADVR
ncbi:DUF3037 domain-containing protein [Sphaerobacter sp.]|uniref:DUF3037 domain-containing protein n=1 Tax=Sphaerobacter sp. TaxID=2099654 RepID=UPI001DB5DCDF|nr:DUF3037 domain-containing protein [Sphaerobacter sp.]MBX5445412.1 DUF3037 domain-containing protein [Sphaerobacter sp.]